MKQVRFAGSGFTPADVELTIPAGSQLTHIRVCPGEYTDPDLGPRLGTWIRINQSKPIMLRCLTILCADTFGFCCETDNQLPYPKKECDRFPGDVQIQILIGTNARPDDVDPESIQAGASPDDWMIVYLGGP